MSPADLVAIASIGSTLQILTDFTTDQAKVLATLQAFAAAEGTATADVDASTMASDEAANAATAADTTAVDASAQELDTFNNDMRLRGLKTICDNLLHVAAEEGVLYFSSGMQRNGSDNQVELRAATNSCVRANVTLNPVDSRGLQAVVPGGNARQGSRGGVGAFSGRNVANQFAQLGVAAGDAADARGRHGRHRVHRLERLRRGVRQGRRRTSRRTTSSATPARIPDRTAATAASRCRLKPKIDAKLRAREGYYADRDFTHTAKADRETQLQEQLMMAIPATDVPLFVTAGYFRLPATTQCPGAGPGGRRAAAAGSVAEADPAAVGAGPAVRAVSSRSSRRAATTCRSRSPCLATPCRSSKDAVTLDVRGYVRDERGTPFATIKDTLTVPPGTHDTLASKQVLYQTGTTLPAGHYRAKIVVRENTTGQMGTFEAQIAVPDLRRQKVKVSSVVLSTQLQSAVGRKTVSPLVRDNVEIVPEPHARREPGSEAVLLLRGLRSRTRRPTRTRRCARASRSIAAR